MQVFKFHVGALFFAYAAQTKEQAIAQFADEYGHDNDYTSVEEIPESEWDVKMINMWEDNDMSKKPFKTSIREIISGTEPQIVFTNDLDF